MGQRHQILIRIANPLKKEDFLNAVTNYDSKGDKLARAIRIFGNKKTSIIPYHHQWLYGATATAILYRLMDNAVRAKGEGHPFSPDYDNLPYPKDSGKDRIEGFFELMNMLVNIQDNIEFSEIARYGVEGAFYIGEECYNAKGKKVHGDIRTDCTLGDNNDGIMIVDTITKKYCFMNIFSEIEENADSVYSLPPMTPVSAVEYASAYYPTTKATLSNYTKEENDDVTEILKGNIEVVKLIEKFTEQFQVLSLKELAEIFPKNFKTKKAKK